MASASVWTLSSMAAMSVMRLASQVALTYLCLPEHFAVVTLMRTFLTFVEMVSDMGIRNAVISHPRGEERRFLGTAFSVQLVRGLGMWLVTCAIAWPVVRKRWLAPSESITARRLMRRSLGPVSSMKTMRVSK